MSSRNEESVNAAGAEIRRDLCGEAVIVSPGRAGRPNDYRESRNRRRARCPFCPGRENRTPPEVDAFREDGSAPDSPGWSVRAVPNRYPAVPPAPAGEGGAWGVHEVIVETPDHERVLADQPEEQIARVLSMYQRRLRAARSDPRIEYACIFKNHGPEAGASLEHPHSQLIALPFVPRSVAEELPAHRRGELSARLAAAPAVLESSALKAFCPPDARLPYELWMAPKAGGAAFEDAAEGVVGEAAAMLRRLLGAMSGILGAAPYHLLVRTAPFQRPEGYCWRLEIIPRTVRIAGFELATGVFINQTGPEAAAEAYRTQLRERAKKLLTAAFR